MSDQSVILFFFDYVDPLSWIMEHRLQTLVHTDQESSDHASIRRAGPRIERLPLELAPPGTPPLLSSDPAWQARTDEALAAATIDGLRYEPAALIPRSRKAIELAFLAAEREAFDRVHRMLFEAHLSRGLDIGRVDVLVTLASEAGLDRTEAKAVLDVDRHTADVEAWRARALALGAAGIPTILIGSRRFEGLVGQRDLIAALDDL